MVTLIFRKMEYQLKPGMTLAAALVKLNILPETVLAILEGELVTEDEIIQDGQTIKLLEVISGG